MSQYYFEVNKEDLLTIDHALEIIQRVEDVDNLDLYVYGIVTDETVLDAAKEAIIENVEEFMDEEGNPNVSEEDVQLSEIAIAIPASDIYGLFGSGVKLTRLGFAYKMGEGEGIRTGFFYNTYTAESRYVNFNKVTTMAIASSDIHLDRFLVDKGKGTAMQVQRKVQRTEGATTPEPVAPQHKQTSLKESVGKIVEKFLG